MMEQDAFTDPAVYSRWYEKDPMHKQYVGEILAVYEKTEKKDANIVRKRAKELGNMLGRKFI